MNRYADFTGMGKKKVVAKKIVNKKLIKGGVGTNEKKEIVKEILSKTVIPLERKGLNKVYQDFLFQGKHVINPYDLKFQLGSMKKSELKKLLNNDEYPEMFAKYAKNFLNTSEVAEQPHGYVDSFGVPFLPYTYSNIPLEFLPEFNDYRFKLNTNGFKKIDNEKKFDKIVNKFDYDSLSDYNEEIIKFLQNPNVPYTSFMQDEFNKLIDDSNIKSNVMEKFEEIEEELQPLIFPKKEEIINIINNSDNKKEIIKKIKKISENKEPKEKLKKVVVNRQPKEKVKKVVVKRQPKEKVPKVYKRINCDINDKPRTRRGTVEECINKNKVNYYGKEAITKEELEKSVNKAVAKALMLYLKRTDNKVNKKINQDMLSKDNKLSKAIEDNRIKRLESENENLALLNDIDEIDELQNYYNYSEESMKKLKDTTKLKELRDKINNRIMLLKSQDI